MKSYEYNSISNTPIINLPINYSKYKSVELYYFFRPILLTIILISLLSIIKNEIISFKVNKKKRNHFTLQKNYKISYTKDAAFDIKSPLISLKK